jgi:hypothetical protein
MPLITRHTKIPPPPELGEKTFWDYFPKQSVRRVVFLLIALGLVLFLRGGNIGSSLGGLFDSIGGSHPRRGGQIPPGAESAPVIHLKLPPPAPSAQ